MKLLPSELRVLGCLLEKQRTTPDVYPLSLNALRLACNQTTSRDPIVNYDEGVLRDALHRLERRGYVRLASGAGSRAPKYRHLLDEALPMSAGERALLCVLMLRGPQTPGELKQRAERLHAFPALDDVQRTLGQLIERGLAARLERRPGQKEERYQQLLGEGVEAAAAAPTQIDAPVSIRVDAPASPRVDAPALPSTVPEAAAATPGYTNGLANGRADRLEERIARLEREVAELRSILAS
jgi:uncharacterized protein YceH (UPF0502 family)